MERSSISACPKLSDIIKLISIIITVEAMRVNKEEGERLKTEGEEQQQAKQKSLQFQLSSGLTLQFGKPIKLPFIHMAHHNSELSSRTEENLSFLTSLRNSANIRMWARGTLG